MNEIQQDAYKTGYRHIGEALQTGATINLPTLTAWVNQCLANDNTVEAKVQLHGRDKDGNLTKTTTLEGRRSELAGYRLLGAFAAVESMRVALASKGVTFNMKAPS